MNIKTVGSLCSGIEAASVAWANQNWKFQWFSEIADFPSRVLKHHYPKVENLGDMNRISELIDEGAVEAPDLICGGTPCQAFSLAGWKKGLDDDRGNLTLEFVNIIEANDKKREQKNAKPSIVLWENVEGVLTDKTNAFGCLVSSLAGLTEPMVLKKWASAGILKGPKRNVAWRVLDAKYFGLAQQRKRLYLVAGGKEFSPENVLFELCNEDKYLSNGEYPKGNLQFTKDNIDFEVFRSYADCLYAAYGTKWNGNAAAYNGSLFVSQSERVRRLSPLECERLMGFPDNYTDIPQAKKTNRYQALGNSWAVPVISWIGQRLEGNKSNIMEIINKSEMYLDSVKHTFKEGVYYDLSASYIRVEDKNYINASQMPNQPIYSDMQSVVCTDAPKDIYISPTGCFGILRRKNERKLNMNSKLEKKLLKIADELSPEEIEKRSRVQRRGKFSEQLEASKKNGVIENSKDNQQLTLF